LRKRHEITFLALSQPDVDEAAKSVAEEYSKKQIWLPWKDTPKQSVGFIFKLAYNHFFSDQPYVIQKYFSQPMAAKIQELASSGQFDLIVCDFLTPSVNLLLSQQKLTTPILLFQHNVESLIWKRLFENAKGILKRIYFQNQWKRMEKFERETCKRCEAVLGVSDDDCRILRSQFGLTNVLGSVPTGVDLSYFCPTTDVRKMHSLVFLGSMDWMPNIDAVLYFAETIFPVVKKRFPEATFRIVGRNPTQAVKDLEKQNGILVTGSVADVRPHLAESEVMIVPLRIGGGTRIKIYEGMATGIPIISSTIGAEGLPVTHRENILLADSPVDFAQSIMELWEEAELRNRIGTAGRVLVERHFGWEPVTKIFERYCFSTFSPPKDQISAYEGMGVEP
jgi:glycosyltransferase involved in cell wall biosynthesis